MKKLLKETRPLTTLETAKILNEAGVCETSRAARNLHLRKAEITYIQFTKGGKLYFLENEIFGLIETAKKGGKIWK